MMQVKLHSRELWNQFAQLGNEMIVTKKGRNMFPNLKYSVYGLEEKELYQPSLQFIVYDEKKYRFMEGNWDSFEPLPEATHYPREALLGEPQAGAEMMKRGITCEKLKITNGDDVFDLEKPQVKLQSLRKYIPILSIYKISKFPMEPPIKVAQFRFEETAFIAVTAYQNMNVKDLKVKNNKYAHGFRENAQKRHSTSPPSSSVSDESTYSPAGGGKRMKLSPPNSENLPPPNPLNIPPSPYNQFPHVPMYPFDQMQPYFDPNSAIVSPYYPPQYYQNYNNHLPFEYNPATTMNPWMGMNCQTHF